MTPILDFAGKMPVIGDDAFVAPNATLIGDIELSAKTGIFYGAVLRGDTETISIGHGSNVQDNSVIHSTPGFPVAVGSGVSVGHAAVLHGCSIADNCLIGMSATVMNGAKIGEHSIIAAGSVVLEGTEIPARSLVAGVPAKVRRNLTDLEVQSVEHNAARYLQLSTLHRLLNLDAERWQRSA